MIGKFNVKMNRIPIINKILGLRPGNERSLPALAHPIVMGE